MFPIVSGLAAWLGSYFPATFGTRPTIVSRIILFPQAGRGFALAVSVAPLFAAIVATVVFFKLLRAADLPQPTLRLLGRSKPGAEEVAANPRARSAVMRVAEKLAPVAGKGGTA